MSLIIIIFSSYLTNSFKKKDSEMMAYVTPTFGPKSWELHLQKLKHKKLVEGGFLKKYNQNVIT